MISRQKGRAFRLVALLALAVLLAAAALAGCGSGPDLSWEGGQEEGPDGVHKSEKVSIAYLKSLARRGPVRIADDIRIEGRVVSSDRSGNLYQTLHVEDATGGMAVRLADGQLFKRYPYGREVSVSCNSLVIGHYGGLPQLGENFTDGDYEIEPVPERKIASVVWLFGDSAVSAQPSTIAIADASERYLNCLVRIEGVQFAAGERGLGWCDPETDEQTGAPTGRLIDTDRRLVDRGGDTLAVRTSRHCIFADRALPGGSGAIEGILGRFNDHYQLTVFDIGFVDMENSRF